MTVGRPQPSTSESGAGRRPALELGGRLPSTECDGVAGVAEDVGDLGELDDVGVVGQRHRLRREVDGAVVDTAELVEGLLDVQLAGVAVHRGHGQRDSLHVEVLLVGGYVVDDWKRRRRRLFDTTNRLEPAMAMPASIGLSRPAAAIGIAATL